MALGSIMLFCLRSLRRRKLCWRLGCEYNTWQRTLLFCWKSSSRKEVRMQVMPMKRLMTMRQMYAVLGSLKKNDAGYIIGVIDHLSHTTSITVVQLHGISLKGAHQLHQRHSSSNFHWTIFRSNSTYHGSNGTTSCVSHHWPVQYHTHHITGTSLWVHDWCDIMGIVNWYNIMNIL